MHFVFIYGTATDVTTMLRRCPDARRVEPGKLYGHRLNHQPHATLPEAHRPAIEPNQHAHVCGYLFEITAPEFEKLCLCEGAPVHARVSRRKIIGESGAIYSALIFIPLPVRVRTTSLTENLMQLQREYRRLGHSRLMAQEM